MMLQGGLLLRAFHRFYGIHLISLSATLAKSEEGLDALEFSIPARTPEFTVRYVVPNSQCQEAVLGRSDSCDSNSILT
jgi:hypothetical protein